MTRQRSLGACEILLFPTADRRFDRRGQMPHRAGLIWVKFPTVRSVTQVKYQGIAGRGGGDGWF